MALYKHCDNDQCDTHERDDTTMSGWIYVNPQSGGTHHFCSWRCVSEFAATKVPMVTRARNETVPA